MRHACVEGLQEPRALGAHTSQVPGQKSQRQGAGEVALPLADAPAARTTVPRSRPGPVAHSELGILRAGTRQTSRALLVPIYHRAGPIPATKTSCTGGGLLGEAPAPAVPAECSFADGGEQTVSSEPTLPGQVFDRFLVLAIESRANSGRVCARGWDMVAYLLRQHTLY